MGDADPTRAGARTLLLLATPLNYLIFKALAARPLPLAALRRVTGLPAQTTLRGHLSSLAALGLVAKRATTEVPYAVENELTAAGRALLGVAVSLEAWLSHAPGDPLSLESGSARGIVKAFVDGWASAMLCTLALEPMSLTELDAAIVTLSYPALERRLASMRMAGLVEAAPSNGGSRPYALTSWARQGVVPLAAASHCEQVHMRQCSAPLSQLDVEAAFMLSVPLVGLSQHVAGRCHLTVEGDPEEGRERTGVEVTVKGGHVVACPSGKAPGAGSYASGSPGTWIDAMREGRPELLDYAGAEQLPRELVSGLQSALLQTLPATS